MYRFGESTDLEFRSGSDHRLEFFGTGFVDRANGEPNSMFDKL